MQDPFTTQAPDPYDTNLQVSAISKISLFGDRPSKPTYRRAQMLAVTRRLIADEGFDRVTLRSVSESCSITAQTIHNSFGSKADLLLSALNEHTLMIDTVAYRGPPSPYAFIRLAVAYCQNAADRPEFMREFMRAAFSSKQSVREPLMKFGVALKTQFLTTLAEKNLLKPCLSPHVAAEQIAYTNAFALGEWAETGNTARLSEQLITGNGTLLLGMLAPPEARKIERWLCDPMNRGWQPQSGLPH